MKSLFIKNFKQIKNLEIDGIERVNLFTGKNNTGKSSLLEAIALYVNQGDLQVIRQILEDRGELNLYKSKNNLVQEQQNIDALSTLFTDRIIDFKSNNEIIISSKLQNSDKSSLRLKIVKYYDETLRNDEGEMVRKRIILDDDNEKNLDINIETGFQIQYFEYPKLIPLNKNIFSFARHLNYTAIDNFEYIRSGTSTIEKNGNLWDKITLTEKEDYVIEGLKIIEPKIDRIAFVGESRRERIAVVKLRGTKSITTLQGMGDGINRILAIILAAVNSENRYLLIDEFENGLHYSVQKQLWEIIFKLANDLNIQVFATTHSNDCINGFEEVLNNNKYDITGKLYRLEKHDDQIRNVVFDKHELKIATEADIETR